MDATAPTEAAQADKDFKAGVDRGPLQGIPLGIKDIIATDNAPTTAQSLVLDPAWGEQGDGPVMKRLRAAGAVITGKTSTMEFATGLPDPEKPFPVPRNPWNEGPLAGWLQLRHRSRDRRGALPGRTGHGHRRQHPWAASFCGISGIKPTYGLVPKSGCVPLGYSLDHIGPLARSVRDCAMILQAIAGYDPSDPACKNVPISNYMAAFTDDLKGVRIAVERANHTRVDGVLPEAGEAFEQAVEVLQAAGATVIEVIIPHYREIQLATRVCNRSEAAAYHMVDLQMRWGDYGIHTRAGLGSGVMYSAVDVVQAQRVRRYGKKAIAELMRPFDVLVTLARTDGAPALDGLTFESNNKVPTFTNIWNGLGLPALCIPMGFTNDRLPLSLQIVGKPFDEPAVLRVGDAFQQRTDWHLQTPPL